MIRNHNNALMGWLAAGLAVVITIVIMVGVCITGGEVNKDVDRTQYISTEYVEKIFDDTYVHEIDIQIPKVNWDYMIDNALDEQYVLCDAIIDGEKIENIALRPKGNSSLDAISIAGDEHFSFKIEFDHYQKNNTYYGLDKLALNNLGQDVSCMKDFLCYHMMNEIGIAAPLSSYVQIKVNGEDFGLYLAVEAVEDSFAYRNYGKDFGNIYKPECLAMAVVDPSAFMDESMKEAIEKNMNLGPTDRFEMTSIAAPAFKKMCGETMDVAAFKYLGDELDAYNIVFDSSVFELHKEDKQAYVDAVRILNQGVNIKEQNQSVAPGQTGLSENSVTTGQINSSKNSVAPGQTGSSENSVAPGQTGSSENRVNTSSEASPQSALDVESVLKYLVVQNFVNNYDGYTGVFDHNYYVREYNGQLSMIPWDYNLAFGAFTMKMVDKLISTGTDYHIDFSKMKCMSDEKSSINYPIDTPCIGVEMEERPLINVLLSEEEYLEIYHQYFDEFITLFFKEGKFEELFTRTWNNIEPYIQKGQTFYTYEDAVKGMRSVHDYCLLREESIEGQLDGSIPATMEGQKARFETLIEPGELNIADSVTYDGFLFGVGSKEVAQILDAIAGDKPHTMQGVELSINLASKDPKKIGEIVLRVLKNSDLVKKGLFKSLAGPVMFLVSLIVLIIAIKRVKKYKRT